MRPITTYDLLKTRLGKNFSQGKLKWLPKADAQRSNSPNSSIIEFNLDDDDLGRQNAGTLASEEGSENDTHHSTESDANSDPMIRITCRQRRRAELSKRPSDFDEYSVNQRKQGSAMNLDQTIAGLKTKSLSSQSAFDSKTPAKIVPQKQFDHSSSLLLTDPSRNNIVSIESEFETVTFSMLKLKSIEEDPLSENEQSFLHATFQQD